MPPWCLFIVLAKSFARIHRSNLINSGILPLVFADPADYDKISLEDELVIENAPKQVMEEYITLVNKTKNESYQTRANLQEMEKAMILAGGKINMMKQQ